MASSKEKKILIEKIKNDTKFFDLRFEQFGAESVMGYITKEAYTYWKKKPQKEFDSYMSQYREMNMLNHVPITAQLTHDWNDIDDLAHLSGPYLASSNVLYIDQYDKEYKFEDTVLKLPLNERSLTNAGITICLSAEWYQGHPALAKKQYFIGESKERGVWHTDDKICCKFGEFDPSLLSLEYVDFFNNLIISRIEYSGLSYNLTASVTGVSFNMGLHNGSIFGKQDKKKTI